VNDELAWVLQAQQGNDEAFTRLVEEHQTHVYNLCYRMLGEPEFAEDAAQETFLRAHQNLHRFDQSRSFATWLLSIGAHYCIDQLRRRRLSVFSMDEEGDDGTVFEVADPASPDPEAESVKREDRDRLRGVREADEDVQAPQRTQADGGGGGGDRSIHGLGTGYGRARPRDRRSS